MSIRPSVNSQICCGNRIGRIEKVQRPGERVEEIVGDAPGVAALAEHEPLDLEVFRGLADAQGDLLHVVIRADEHAEIGGLRRVGAERPADASFVQHLRVADQAFHVGRSEEVGARRDEQDVGAFPVERQFDPDAGFFFDLVLEALERILERLRREAQIVADLEDLADNLVRIFLAEADRVHDVASGHGNLGGVDAERAIDGAAPALRALVEIGVPVRQHRFGQVLSADEPG